jgi:kumamolisin
MRLLRTLALLLTGAALCLPALFVPGSAGTPTAAFGDYQTSGQQPFGYSPSQIATAYDITPLYQRGVDGSGQTIAFIELDRFDPADLQTFNTAAKLPQVSVKQSYAGGKAFTLIQAGETTMDLEWAHAVAPRAALKVYYLKTAKSTGGRSWHRPSIK